MTYICPRRRSHVLWQSVVGDPHYRCLHAKVRRQPSQVGRHAQHMILHAVAGGHALLACCAQTTAPRKPVMDEPMPGAAPRPSLTRPMHACMQACAGPCLHARCMHAGVLPTSHCAACSVDLPLHACWLHAPKPPPALHAGCTSASSSALPVRCCVLLRAHARCEVRVHTHTHAHRERTPCLPRTPIVGGARCSRMALAHHAASRCITSRRGLAGWLPPCRPWRVRR